VSVVDAYIYGFALQQINLPLQSPEQVAEVGEGILRQMAGEYPHLTEIIREHARAERHFRPFRPCSQVGRMATHLSTGPRPYGLSLG